MLRRCVLALACLATLKSAPVQAEAVKAEPAPAPSNQSNSDAKAGEPQPSMSSETPAPSTAAPSTSTPSTSAPTEPGKTAESAAPAKPAPPPEPTMKVAIDLKTQRMTVSEHGTAKYTWPISSGTAEFPTPRGTFRPQWTAKMWYSKKYDNAPMPHAVFINGGVAVHATYHTRALGRPASHGCIRLAPANAATFYKLVHKHGLKMTRVSVYGTPKYSAPAVASRNDQPRRYAGYGNYRATSAYDPGFTRPRYRNKPPRIYYYSNNGAPRYSVRSSGPRVVYYRPRRTQYKGFGYDW